VSAESTLVDRCVSRLVVEIGDIRAALASATLDTIRNCIGIAVTEREEYRSSGFCAVDGCYFQDPPRIIIAAAAEPRRRAFTALHELAHHLIRNDWDLMWLARDRNLEEEVCDEFAAEVLDSAELCDRLLSMPPTALEFVALYESSNASRASCARRVASRIPSTGHAVVTLGTVTAYCATAHSPFRSQYEVDQGEDSIFGSAVRDGSAKGQARLVYRESVVSPIFNAEAVRSGEHVFAIFVEIPDYSPDGSEPPGVLHQVSRGRGSGIV